jgi:hypothetical protein
LVSAWFWVQEIATCSPLAEIWKLLGLLMLVALTCVSGESGSRLDVKVRAITVAVE